MNLARKSTVALVVAILGVLAVYACVQLRDEVVVSATSIRLSYRAFALATVVFMAICAAIASMLRPGDTKGRVEADEVSAPLTPPPGDGLHRFAREINRQVAVESEAHVAALEQLRHTDRLTTVGHLAAGIAHELGTPLSVISGRAELIATTDLPRAEVVHSSRAIVEQADRMTAIIRQLLDFSRRDIRRRVEIDLREVVTTTLDLISGIANKAKVEIVCEAGAVEVPVCIDKNMMLQALINIVLNGIQAMPNGGRLRVEVQPCQAQPPLSVAGIAGPYQCVIVEDNGVGISPAHLPQVFEPFFTTKGVGEGTGLGLQVAHRIVHEHGGWIAVDSVEGQGSRFSIMLPLPPAAAQREAAA